MPRQKIASKPTKNRYTLREGMTEIEGGDLIRGPEFIHRSLEQAYKIRHKLEEAGQITEEWEKARKAREAARVKASRAKMFEKVGEEPPEE